MIRSDHRVEFFDHLRALAVTLVVMAHYIGTIVPGGSIGVSIFFCLSGFLIMSILLREQDLTLKSAGAFIVRRFMRVFPAYLTAILVMLALMQATHSDRLPALIDALPGLLTFTKMPQSIGMETGVFWTLHVEFWFYVTIPFLVMLFGRGKALVGIFVLLVGLSFVFKLSPAIPIVVPNLGPFSGLIFWIDNLLYGSFVAILAANNRIRIPKPAVPVLIYGGLAALIALAAFVSSEDRLLVWPLMATAASFSTAVILAAFVSTNRDELHFFSRARIGIAVAWIGKISYSIYLYHAIPLDYHALLPKALIPSLPLLIIAAAAASYYLIETPGIALGRKLAAKRPERQR